MDRLEFDDVELTYTVGGDGDRVVLVHASPFVSWYAAARRTSGGVPVLRYQRRLRPDGSGRFRPFTIGDDAAICAKLMAHVGWDTAHIVGHSYGGLVALELAINTPERVGQSAYSSRRSERDPERRAAGDCDAADRRRLQIRRRCGRGGRVPAPGVRRRLPGRAGPRLPDAFGAALGEADLFFQMELPAVQQWSLAPSDAQRITQPVLNVLGADSAQRFVEGSELVQSWFPHAERLSVPAAGHLLMVQNPTAVAQGLNNFVSRHPTGIVALADRDRGLAGSATPDEEETMRIPISHPRRIAGSGVLSALLALSACGDHVGDRAVLDQQQELMAATLAAIAGDARERGQRAVPGQPYLGRGE